MSLLERESAPPTVRRARVVDVLWPRRRAIVLPIGRRDEPPPRGRLLRDICRTAVVVTLLNLFVVQISVVRGHSMMPSLHDGDRLVVDRVAYDLGDVSRFDVVILRYPADPSVDFVKRVVGLPGDHVCIHQGVLFVNGDAVPQRFGHIEDTVDMPERVVPPNSYFVLGDNRPISCDSREFGVVPRDLLRGKVWLRFWPFDAMQVF